MRSSKMSAVAILFLGKFFFFFFFDLSFIISYAVSLFCLKGLLQLFFISLCQSFIHSQF